MVYIYAYPRSSIRHVSRQIDVSVDAIHTISKNKTKCSHINLSLSNISSIMESNKIFLYFSNKKKKYIGMLEHKLVII